MKTKEEYGELYYGKENLMNTEKGSMVLSTIHSEELREKTKEIMELYGWDINDASQCQKALKEAKTMLKIKKVKKVRYHVDLSEEMGKDLTDIAEKIGLTLSAVVKLMLMQNWMRYKYGGGFDYLYLGVADRPKAPGEIPY